MNNLTTYRNGTNSFPRNRNNDVEFLALDDKLRDEMKRLSDVNDELLGKVHSDLDIRLPQQTQAEDRSHAVLEELRAENAQLRQRLREAEGLLEQLAGTEDTWSERQKEYEALLDEKSEVIRSLHLKVRELQEGVATGGASRAAENEEIRKLKEAMAEQRRQLEEDEKEVMKQMRQMEMAMSRDRAELARQRNEMQRMQAELNHEIEMASRDPGLREKLLSLQRRQQETLARKGGSANNNGIPPLTRPEPAAQPAAPVQPETPRSGFFGRMFGK